MVGRCITHTSARACRSVKHSVKEQMKTSTQPKFIQSTISSSRRTQTIVTSPHHAEWSHSEYILLYTVYYWIIAIDTLPCK